MFSVRLLIFDGGNKTPDVTMTCYILWDVKMVAIIKSGRRSNLDMSFCLFTKAGIDKDFVLTLKVRWLLKKLQYMILTIL